MKCFHCLCAFIIGYVLAPENIFHPKSYHISYHQHRRTKPGMFFFFFHQTPSFSVCFISDISTVPVWDVFVQCGHDVIHSAVVFELSCWDVRSLVASHNYTHIHYIYVALVSPCAFHSQQHRAAEKILSVVTWAVLHTDTFSPSLDFGFARLLHLRSYNSLLTWQTNVDVSVFSLGKG